MIGKNIRANASFPIQEPSKIAYLVIAAVIVLLYVVGAALASSVSV